MPGGWNSQQYVVRFAGTMPRCKSQMVSKSGVQRPKVSKSANLIANVLQPQHCKSDEGVQKSGAHQYAYYLGYVLYTYMYFWFASHALSKLSTSLPPGNVHNQMLGYFQSQPRKWAPRVSEATSLNFCFSFRMLHAVITFACLLLSGQGRPLRAHFACHAQGLRLPLRLAALVLAWVLVELRCLTCSANPFFEDLTMCSVSADQLKARRGAVRPCDCPIRPQHDSAGLDCKLAKDLGGHICSRCGNRLLAGRAAAHLRFKGPGT